MSDLDLDELLNEVSSDTNEDYSTENNVDLEAIKVDDTVNDTVEIDDISQFVHKYSLEDTKKKAKKSEDSDKYLEEYIEDIQDSVKKYLSERYRINEEIKALKEELKELKDEMKDEGIKVTAVDKAFKEMVSELKEDSNDAILIESVKNMIKKDASLYGMVREEAL